MEKEDYHQLELFSQAKKYDQTKPKFTNAFSNLIWAYEKTILVIFGLIITGIVSFSLGVEKGKRLMISETNLRSDFALKKMDTAKPAQASTPAESEQDNQPVIKRTVKAQPELSVKESLHIQNYTIQIASFRTKAFARKEAEQLKRKGYTAVIFSKGSFSIVCVGNFPKQESAKTLLTELKRFYHDSYIRRL